MAEGKNVLSGIPFFVQALIVLLLGGVIVGVVHFGFCEDVRAETEKKRVDLAKLREDNRKGAIVRDNLKAYQKRYEQAQTELRDLRELLPEDVEISKVLENIQQQATEQKLVLRNFVPRDPIKREFFKEKPISIQVTGLYNNLGRFFQQLATYRRIVNISDVDIRKASEQTDSTDINASFTVTAFFASEQDVINIGEKEGGK
ncbi:MAG: type 4a pilus biogenesis protein PilO [Acidobacteriota bacterium]